MTTNYKDIFGSDNLTGVIMAAGRGTRAYQYTNKIPKALLEIEGRSLIEGNIILMRDKLKMNKIIVVLGHMHDQIKQKLGDGSKYGVQLDYIILSDEYINEGLIGGIKAIEAYVNKYFFMILGDELYLNSDHEKMLEKLASFGDYDIAIMYRETLHLSEIRNNYAVDIEGDYLRKVVEKPSKATNDFAGLGTIFFSSNIFDVIKSSQQKNPHIMDMINTTIKQGGKTYAFKSECSYVNVNNRYDYYRAKFLYRSLNFSNFKKSVVIPAYNEAGSISYVVRDFLQYADEVIVMDNLSPDGTAEIAKKSGAIVKSLSLKGYGDAIKKGMELASGDIIILVEADGTFQGQDIEKLTSYLKDADAVIGSRTHREYIDFNANMGGLLRLGNKMFGLIITALWYNRKCHFTDVGCTYRAMWKSSYYKIKDRLLSDGPALSPEIMIELLNSFLRVIEVPVNYRERCLGESKFSGSFWHSAKTALKMLRVILHKRFKSWFENLAFLFKRVRAKE